MEYTEALRILTHTLDILSRLLDSISDQMALEESNIEYVDESDPELVLVDL